MESFIFTSLSILLFTSFSLSESKEIVVGGKQDMWKVPESSNQNVLNQWAEKTRFRIGDSLVFSRDPVLEVTKEDYDSCNTSKPLKEYKEGNNTIGLDRSGPFYFISGVAGNCEKGQKIAVVVLSVKHSVMPPAEAPGSNPASDFGPSSNPASGLGPASNPASGLGPASNTASALGPAPESGKNSGVRAGFGGAGFCGLVLVLIFV